MATLFESALTNLVDEGQAVSSKALSMLSSPSRGESTAFAQAWPSISLERRRTIISKMVELGEERFDLDYSALYRTCLNDPDAQVRSSAIEGLWEDEGWDLASTLIRLLLSDPDQMVRASAATSLGRFVYMAECDEIEAARAFKLRSALEQVIDNPQESSEVVRRAIEAIAFINDEHVKHIIESAYAVRDEAMKTSAVFAMGRNADPYWADIVLAELGSASAAIRYEAARASGEIQLDRAVPILINLTQDSDSEVQQMAIWALGQVGGKQAESALKALTQNKNEAVSDAAVEALDMLEFDAHPMDMLVHNIGNDIDMSEVDLTSAYDDEVEGSRDELEDADESDDEDTTINDLDDEPLDID